MNLSLVRDAWVEDVTLGKLYVDGVYECETLEDFDRRLEADGEKIPDETCIPRGTYVVVVDFSQRFRRELPRLLEVPQFEGVRIHPGNYARDTSGCILVGQVRNYDSIGRSVLAFNHLFPQLETAYERNEPIQITIS